MSHIVQDEDGGSWYVGAGDPAWEACEALGARGYRLMVLPRHFIMGGPKPHPTDIIPLVLKLQQAFGATHDPDLRQAFRLYVRLYDCLAAVV